MKKKAGIVLGCLILTLLVFVGVRQVGYDLSPSDESEPSFSSTIGNSATASSSSFVEDVGFMEGYYWNGYLDQREKIQDSIEEKEYKDTLIASQIPEAIEGSGDSWYRVDDLSAEVPDGSYVKVTYKGPILEMYPAIFSSILKVEIIE